MTGYQSKKNLRFADDVTLSHLIDLRKLEAENERLREALRQAQCNCEEPCLQGQWCSSWIALNALKEKE